MLEKGEIMLIRIILFLQEILIKGQIIKNKYNKIIKEIKILVQIKINIKRIFPKEEEQVINREIKS
jgi:hypothetical protein